MTLKARIICVATVVLSLGISFLLSEVRRRTNDSAGFQVTAEMGNTPRWCETERIPTAASELPARAIAAPEGTERSSNKLQAAMPSNPVSEAIPAAVERLRPEERTQLGSPPSPMNDPAVNPASSVKGHVEFHQQDPSVSDFDSDKPSVPLAFLEPTRSAEWDEDLISRLDDLREHFVDDVGGTDQNPADPDYLERWEEAQPLNDERFRAWFGNEALTQLQVQAASRPNP